MEPQSRQPRLARDTDQRIYDSIFAAVMQQRLKPGTRLPESELGKLFGVSRTVVRKGLQRLAHDGIVSMRHNKGAAIASPSREETSEVFEARRAIEAAIVPLVVQRADAAGLARLRAMLATEHEMLHNKDAGWVQQAGAFHHTLAELSGNRVLQDFLRSLMSRCSLIVALYEAPGDAGCEHDEHAAIVEHIARGEADAAVALMTRHLDALEHRIQIRSEESEPDLGSLLGL
ncbi:MAG: GntR family transcriptional regulator [Rhodocyclaceae bacterium]